MRALLGVVSLLIVVVVVMVLVKSQLGALPPTPIHPQNPVFVDQAAASPAVTPQLQSQQIQQQIARSVEAAMRQARTLPENAE